MAVTQALVPAEATVSETTPELVVAWQDPATRRYHAVGLLRHTQDGLYEFRYLEEAGSLARFRPFLGFSEIGRTYESPHLFPLFAERVLDQARPDRTTMCEALDLLQTAGPMEFLARSGGRRAGDCIQLLPAPQIRDGRTSFVFLVHGVRHVEGAHAAIDGLKPGDALVLVPEPQNPIDADAVVVARDGARLGWVPNPMLTHVRAVMSTGDCQLRVVRTNPRDLGNHLRLLVRLEGAVPAGFVAPWGSSPARGT